VAFAVAVLVRRPDDVAEIGDVRLGGPVQQEHSDTMIPITSPGSVSKSRTPIIAVTAAMKSGRAALP